MTPYDQFHLPSMSYAPAKSDGVQPYVVKMEQKTVTAGLKKKTDKAAPLTFSDIEKYLSDVGAWLEIDRKEVLDNGRLA